MKKIFLIVVAFISLLLGTIGIVLPFLPTVPFFMLTAACFTASSDRLSSWFRSTKLYKNNLESFVKQGGMTKNAKIKVMISITVLMGIGFYLMDAVPIGRIVLLIVWLAHMLYFTFKVKNL
ncbi:MAG: YbaN family protein [Eubacterium sp.]|nr:YbaN family protein [Eubacterium sp.]